MHLSTKKWLFTKFTSLILLPFMMWFILNFVSIFIIIAFFFSSLTISEIFEDYIQDEKIKNVANKLLNIFAIVIPLITIIGIYNL